jgi:hypothetical protein
MLERGADVYFYSSFYSGLCFLFKTSAGIFCNYFFPPGSPFRVTGRVTGQVYAITDIDEWVSFRKEDIESFLLRGRL